MKNIVEVTNIEFTVDPIDFVPTSLVTFKIKGRPADGHESSLEEIGRIFQEAMRNYLTDLQ